MGGNKDNTVKYVTSRGCDPYVPFLKDNTRSRFGYRRNDKKCVSRTKTKKVPKKVYKRWRDRPMLLHRPTQFDEKDFDKQMARLDKMIERHKAKEREKQQKKDEEEARNRQNKPSGRKWGPKEREGPVIDPEEERRKEKERMMENMRKQKEEEDRKRKEKEEEEKRAKRKAAADKLRKGLGGGGGMDMGTNYSKKSEPSPATPTPDTPNTPSSKFFATAKVPESIRSRHSSVSETPNSPFGRENSPPLTNKANLSKVQHARRKMGTETVKEADIEKQKKNRKNSISEDYSMPKQSDFIETKKSFWKEAEEKDKKAKKKQEMEANFAPLTAENLSLKESIEKVKSWKKQLTVTPPDSPISPHSPNKDFRKSELNKADTSHSTQWGRQSGFQPKARPKFFAGVPQFPNSEEESESSASTRERSPSPYDNLATKPPINKAFGPTLKLKPPDTSESERSPSPYDNLHKEVPSKAQTNLKVPGKLWAKQPSRGSKSGTTSSTSTSGSSSSSSSSSESESESSESESAESASAAPSEDERSTSMSRAPSTMSLASGMDQMPGTNLRRRASVTSLPDLVTSSQGPARTYISRVKDIDSFLDFTEDEEFSEDEDEKGEKQKKRRNLTRLGEFKLT